MKKSFCVGFFVIMLIIMKLLKPAQFCMASEFSPNPNSPLKGLSVGFYGDSITAANCEDTTDYASYKGWAGRVGLRGIMNWVNHGVSGDSISTCRGADHTIYSQLKPTIGKNYDMIILHGGTNDAWDNAPIGEISKGFGPSDSYDVSTFAGGLEQLFALIHEENPDAIVGYIINFKFINAKNGTIISYTDASGKMHRDYSLNHMGAYVDMTKQICDKWEVPYLDLYTNDILTAKLHPTATSASGKVTYLKTCLSDFIHPTTEGYNILYPYVETFMQGLVSPVSFEQNEGAEDRHGKDSKEKTSKKSFSTASVSAIIAAVILIAGIVGIWIAVKKQRK